MCGNEVCRCGDARSSLDRRGDGERRIRRAEFLAFGILNEL